MGKFLCETCMNAIWCPTWTEWKCKVKEKRIRGEMTKCSDYKKRDKNFKEPKCQCKNCLENELLFEEED